MKNYETLEEGVENIKPELNGMISGFKQVTLEAVSSAKDRALSLSREAARKVDHSAHENVWTYIGAAAAFSALTGYLLGRRSYRGNSRAH